MKRRWEIVGEFVYRHGFTSGVEVGVWKGQTFFYLLDKYPKLHMIGVDSWEENPNRHKKDMNLGLSTWHAPDVMRRYRAAVMKQASGNRRASIMHMDSLEAAEKVAGPVDFVFIDANHSTEAVIEDVKAWRPKIRKGGVLIGHDQQWPSVQRALKSLFPSWEVNDDNVWSVEC